ncbi:hypothetical protein [Kitasatospora sp. NPDC088134]|uniref:Imm32 family immunity protein n=1 Tax=Kitasatospora sp. NPDC088134 TaxID=3364071 RepID=UPI003815F7DF
MVQVLYSGDPGELELSGTRRELLALGQLLRGKAGSCDLSENQHPFPYEGSLSGVAFREDREHDTVSIVAEDRILWIRGGREALYILAENIEDFAAEADASHHCHVDFPTYDYIAPESNPLVITFMR